MHRPRHVQPGHKTQTRTAITGFLHLPTDRVYSPPILAILVCETAILSLLMEIDWMQVTWIMEGSVDSFTCLGSHLSTPQSGSFSISRHTLRPQFTTIKLSTRQCLSSHCATHPMAPHLIELTLNRTQPSSRCSREGGASRVALPIV